ncbi:formate--tetrahydrofolate ligase [Isobaculum melis]|uniref:Formate--tetrahydrofolate ligase n=1 Tax=Isobaculum melis TaxID=142588 RepID=A0A1H9RWC3_9LACT|nr:formate--tetrahydrofolate ligase [Isobaculum melis]SER77111.1 Formate-tetrahydrofolate ligase [Isobaculum melis]
MTQTDIQIAQAATLNKIQDIALKVGLTDEQIEPYGHYKAKLTMDALKSLETKEDGKLILVTAINPTPAGEGKSTVTIGLADALSRLGKQTMIALREPSLGPTMGIKGGAAGGGHAQVVPMEDINLHFTGDMHAITTANNALSAFIDNHLHHGNELEIDTRRILWKRVVDLNDRSLRHVNVGLGGPMQGVPREDGFDITVASEIMAILCLAKDLKDLKNRLANILIGYTAKKKPIFVRDLEVEGALTLLLKEALKPNLVQTLEHTPAIVHGGPFANIAHGCNSILATQTALKLADYTVTEAGFGADLGAEKFLDIKVPQLGKAPNAIVVVATIRALKMHGGIPLKALNDENPVAVAEGFANLKKHIFNMKAYGIPVVVAINAFVSDTEAEIDIVKEYCEAIHVPVALTEVWEKGAAGGFLLAEKVITAIEAEETHSFTPLYDVAELSVPEKINKIVKNIYGGRQANFTKKALNQIKTIEENGWEKLPICMAKTQYSLSDDPHSLGAPTGFDVTIRELVPKLGAGFIVALTGDVMTMPGLPKYPAALKMDVGENGEAIGLF